MNSRETFSIAFSSDDNSGDEEGGMVFRVLSFVFFVLSILLPLFFLAVLWRVADHAQVILICALVAGVFFFFGILTLLFARVRGL